MGKRVHVRLLTKPDEFGKRHELFLQNSAVDVLVSTSNNTNGEDNTSAIPENVTDMQDLVNELGSLGFKSQVDIDDIDHLVKSSTEVTKPGVAIADAYEVVQLRKQISDLGSLNITDEYLASDEDINNLF